jgi:hypothetical protein
MIVHFIQTAAALIVLAEALNKLQRTDVFDGQHGAWRRIARLRWVLMPWRWSMRRVDLVFKLLGWAAIALGAAGEFVAPPTMHGTCAVLGVAFLIVRKRMGEGFEP